jgi:hypothetical protein
LNTVTVEIECIKTFIERDSASIYTCKVAIVRIEQALKEGKEFLAEDNAKLASIGKGPAQTKQLLHPAPPGQPDYLVMCRRVESMISSGSTTESLTMTKRRSELGKRILRMALMLPSLKRDLDDWNMEQVLSIQFLEAHSIALKTAEAIRDDLKSWLSPVKCVPAEVWEEIFRICDNTRNPRPTKKNPVLIISQVCRNWRLIILESSHFRDRRGSLCVATLPSTPPHDNSAAFVGTIIILCILAYYVLVRLASTPSPPPPRCYRG